MMARFLSEDWTPMNRALAIALTLSLALVASVEADTKKYGTPLTLKDTTKVSAIFAAPATFDGKRVRLEGAIVGVCEERGCWIALSSDQEFQSIRFKVDDGVIVFPLSIKGRTAVIEGVVSVQEVSVKAQIEAGEHEAREHGTTFDASKVKGPRTVIMVKGEGAEVF